MEVITICSFQVNMCVKLEEYPQGIPEISRLQEWDGPLDNQKHNASGHSCRQHGVIQTQATIIQKSQWSYLPGI